MNYDQIRIEKDESLWEEFIKPEGADMPLMYVREQAEGIRVSAVFGIDLSGVNRTEKERGENWNKNEQKDDDWERYLGTLLDGMSKDNELHIIYKGENNGVAGISLNIKFMGFSKGETSDDAIKKAIEFYESLRVVIKSVEKKYSFEPITVAENLIEENKKCEWCGTITPYSVSVSNKEQKMIGFLERKNTSSGKIEVVLTPYPFKKKTKYFDAIAFAVRGHREPIACKLSILPILLSNDDTEKMRSVYKAIQRDNVKVMRPQHKSVELYEDKTLTNRLCQSFDLWVKNPKGFRMKCTVTSPKPIPTTLLTMIGGEVFQGCAITVGMEKNIDKSKNNNLSPYPYNGIGGSFDGKYFIDLTGCISSISTLPPLFPKASTLAECGINRLYTQTFSNGSSDGILLGSVGERDDSMKILFSKADRSRHCYIIGATGTGKSTLLYNKIVQDMHGGEGVTLIDPHGDLYQQVLYSVPEHRKKDVVLVDPCDFEYAAGINFLECSNSIYKQVEMNFVVNEMIKIFDKLYDLRQTGGPLFEQYMRNALLLAMDNEYQGATLMDIPTIFEDRDYRRFLLGQCRNQLVINFWKHQAEKAGGEASLENMGPYITSKLNQFTTNALLRPIIGQPKNTVDFREILDKQKILLVNLSKGLLGELDTQLLGMLIIGKLFSSAMARVKLPQEERKTNFLYVDEFQNFTTDSVAYLLSEARKFGICLILANQNLSQLSTNPGKHSILESVLGNVGTMLIFRLGVRDAEIMQAYMKPVFKSEDLQELPDFHVASRMLVHNTPQKPFVFKTRPMSINGNGPNADQIIENSRARYATPRLKVEWDIMRRLTAYKDNEKSE